MQPRARLYAVAPLAATVIVLLALELGIFQDPIGRVLHEGRAITLGGRALLIATDGTEKALLQVGAPIRNPDGKVLGIGLVFREVPSSRPAPEEAREERFKDLLGECQEVAHPTQSQT